MPNIEHDENKRERQLDAIIAEYYRVSDAGGVADQNEFIERNPDFTAELKEFFSDARLLQSKNHTARTENLLGPTIGLAASRAAKPIAGSIVRYFGAYELLEEIARGGMGVVFRARQVKLNRIVALKMILAGELAGEEEVNRFKTEAKAAANLDHPGIVPIYEIGEHDGQHYFSMGFVEGPSLADRVKDGPLPPREAAEIVRKVAEAVAYAHNKGVIHRDLKPANVLLDACGEPRVTDFGLAKLLQTESDLTLTGAVMGTPNYMPPEQASGKTDEVGPRSDVYSLGAILYCLLTGRPPFQSAYPMDILRQVLEQDPVSPQTLNIGVTKDLDTICLRSLQKDPNRRYQTALQLADELDRFLTGIPIHSRPVSKTERSWRWCKRNPLVTMLAATAFTSLVAGTIVSIFFAIKANDEANAAIITSAIAEENERIAISEGRRAEMNAADAVAQKNKAEKLLYLNQLSFAQREWDLNNVPAAWNYLNSCKAEMRGWEHGYLVSRFTRHRTELIGHVGRVSCVAYSSDAKWIASGSSDGTIIVWDAQSGEQIRAIEAPAAVNCLAFSPDGIHLVAGGGQIESYIAPGDGPDAFSELHTGFVKTWNVAGALELTSQLVSGAVVMCVTYSPDGKRIVGGAGKSVKVWDADTGEELSTLHGHQQPVNCVDISKTGKQIASCSGYRDGFAVNTDNAIKIWDAESGEILQDFTGHAHSVNSIAFSPDETKLVSGSRDLTLKVWDLLKGSESLTLQGHEKQVLAVSFDSSGARIVSGSQDNSVRIWHVTTQQETQILRGHTSAVSSVCFSPDSARVVSGSGDKTVKVWNWKGGDQPLTFNADSAKILTFSRTGDKIASVLGYNRFNVDSSGDALSVWDTHTGEKLLDLSKKIDCFALNPDTSLILTASGSTITTVDAHTLDSPHSVELQRRVQLTNDPGLGSDHFAALAFSPDTKRLVTFSFPWEWVKGEEIPGPGTSHLTIWDATNGKELRTLELDPGRFDAKLVFSPDGQWIASSMRDGTITVWSTVSGDRKQILKGHSDEINCLAFSSDGTRIVSASEDQTIRVWQINNVGPVLTIDVGDSIPLSVAFNPGGTRIASGCEDHTVRLWDAATGDHTITLRGHGSRVASVAFSPDGSRIASATDREIKIWSSDN